MGSTDVGFWPAFFVLHFKYKVRPDTLISAEQRQEDHLIGVILTEFSVRDEDIDPQLAERAWKLAANRSWSTRSDQRKPSIHSRTNNCDLRDTSRMGGVAARRG